MGNDLRAATLVLGYCVASGIQSVLNIEELTVPAGAAVGITGPSGSGKTSLLYVLAGLERPQYGTCAGARPRSAASARPSGTAGAGRT